MVGDGHTHRLNITKAEGITSLLTPDVNQLRLFTPFPDWGSVVEEVDVQTHHLDDLDIDDFDLLKIDIQGAELMVFHHGRERLRTAVAVQTEVSFVPLYGDQPTFGEVDSESTWPSTASPSCEGAGRHRPTRSNGSCKSSSDRDRSVHRAAGHLRPRRGTVSR